MRIAHPIRFIRSAMKDRPAGRRWHSRAARCMIAAGCIIHAPSANAQIPCRYEVSAIIQAPPCPFTGPPPTIGTGISPNGRYVSGYWYHCEISGSFHGFLYDTTTQQLMMLPMPPGISALLAYGVNDTPWVVGHMGGTAGAFGFVYDVNAGQYIAMIPPLVNAGTSSLNAINSRGVACGSRAITDTPVTSNAYRWSISDGVTDLGVMNGPSSAALNITADGVILGWTGDGGPSLQDRGFMYDHGKLTFIPGVAEGGSWAFGLSSQGLLAGYGRVPTPLFARRAFVYDTVAATMHVIVPPPQFRDSFCEAISRSGLAIGSFRTNGTQPFIWRNDEVVDLNSLVSSTNPIFIDNPRAFSQDEAIVAVGHLSGATCTLVLLPRPASIADIDLNCQVDIDDLLTVILQWGNTKSLADINNDNIVNIDDLLLVITEWTIE